MSFVDWKLWNFFRTSAKSRQADASHGQRKKKYRKRRDSRLCHVVLSAFFFHFFFPLLVGKLGVMKNYVGLNVFWSNSKWNRIMVMASSGRILKVSIYVSSYQHRSVRLLYIQLCTCRYMSPRYFDKQHWYRSHRNQNHIHPSLNIQKKPSNS